MRSEDAGPAQSVNQDSIAARVLDLKDLRVHFETYKGTVRALDGVTLDIRTGEILGLVGETGCGKTVTALSLLRLLNTPPARILSGQALFDGKDLLSLPPREMNAVRGNRIAIVFQEAMSSLNPVMTVGDQVAESILLHQRESVCDAVEARLVEGPALSLWGVSRRRIFGWAAKRYRVQPRSLLFRVLERVPILRRWDTPLREEALRRTKEVFEKVRLPEPEAALKKFPHEMSGGMQQRVAIGMALSCNPDLLILDEPTTALDVTIEAQILQLIKGLQADFGMSVLLITHDLGIVAQTCDRVAVMYAGNVVEVANVFDLFRRPLHPYTVALLQAIVAPENLDDLQAIEGSVPDLIRPPTGCRFHPRCPHAMDVCRAVKPPTTEPFPGRTVACYLFPEDENH